MTTKTLKRVEASLSGEIFEVVKEMAGKWGMTTKSYLAMAITRSAMEDKERFKKMTGEQEELNLSQEEQLALRALLDKPYAQSKVFEDFRKNTPIVPYRDVPVEDRL